jgi:hypothetical protein
MTKRNSLLGDLVALAIAAFVLWLLFHGREAHAQSPVDIAAHPDWYIPFNGGAWPCRPRYAANPNEVNAGEVVIEWGLPGIAVGWLCRVKPPIGNDPAQAYWQHHIWTSLFRFAASDWQAEARAITSADDPWAEGTARKRLVTTSEPKAVCEFAMLRRSVCRKLYTPPFAGVQLAMDAATAATFRDNYCGPARDCAAIVVPVAYVVTGAQAFPLKADGTRSITPIAQAPVKGSTCACATKELIVTVSGVVVRYCAVAIENVTQLVVASCSAKK